MKIFDYALDTKSVGEAGEFEGYASTFGNVDQGGDIVEAGAFIKGIIKAKNEGRNIPMLWQHDQREPIGIWKDIAEDAKGLYVKGQLILDGDMTAQRAYGKLKAKALGGLSIGYVISQGGATFDEKKRVQRLNSVELREISLVTMPMNISAKVTSVKSIIESGKLPTLPEFEDFLREAGFSKTQAVAIASKGLANLYRGEPDKNNAETMDFLLALANSQTKKD